MWFKQNKTCCCFPHSQLLCISINFRERGCGSTRSGPCTCPGPLDSISLPLHSNVTHVPSFVLSTFNSSMVFYGHFTALGFHEKSHTSMKENKYGGPASSVMGADNSSRGKFLTKSRFAGARPILRRHGKQPVRLGQVLVLNLSGS